MFSQADISLKIQNNVNYPVQISILGNPYNLKDTVNAKTEYRWNFTSFVFTNETQIIIQYKLNSDTTYQTFSGQLPTQTLQGVVDVLNLLGIGFFTLYTELGSTYIGTYNDNYTFGQLNLFVPSIINPNFFYGSGFDNYTQSVSLQSNGQIMVVGTFSSYNGTASNSVIRLNADGTNDITFTSPFLSTIGLFAIATQTDGKYLVGGSNNIFRLNTNGTFDTSLVTGTGISGGATEVYAIAIQSDGKIIVGGSFTSYNGTGANNIIRLNTDGSVDGTFVYGTGFTGFFTQLGIYSIEIQADGKILIGGDFTSYNGTGANGIIRLNTDGSVDGTFVYGTGFDSYVNNIVQTGGKLLVGGAFSTYQTTNTSYGIIRLNTDGTVDNSFAFQTTFGVEIETIVPLTNTNIVLGGIINGNYNGTTVGAGIVQVTSGNVLTNWATGTGFSGAGVAFAQKIVIQTSSGIVVGGLFTSFNATPANYIIELYT